MNINKLKKMNKKVILLASIVALFMSCNQSKKEMVYVDLASADLEEISPNNIQSDEGYELMKNNCYVCHNPNSASHDEILAPPFKGVKMHYTRAYSNKEDFVNAVVNWVQNPSEDKALMFGAVNRFKIMPKMELPAKDIEKIASYMYDNDVDEPEWMEDHMKEKHEDGKGEGMKKGQGKGMGKGMMKGNKKSCNHKDGKSCGNGC